LRFRKHCLPGQIYGKQGYRARFSDGGQAAVDIDDPGFMIAMDTENRGEELHG
jgi:hypothetical protein